VHRIQSDLTQPWLIGFDRNSFTTRLWDTLDIDPATRAGRG
jgi:hypothetical protein